MGEQVVLPLVKIKKRRIWELDFVRGLCVILMVFDHFMFDCASVFSQAWLASGDDGLMKLVLFATDYMEGTLRASVRPIIVITFFVMCGISCSFSRSNLKRGMEALLFAFGITIVTSLLNMGITFGVLHMLGFAILMWWAIDTICRHNRYVTAVACLVIGILILCGDMILESVGVEYNQDLFFISKLFGGAYKSSDYFPLLPNVGYVLIGASVGSIFYRKKRSLLPFLDRFHWYAPVNAVGKVALWVYVFHQVVVAGILGLVSYIIIGEFVII